MEEIQVDFHDHPLTLSDERSLVPIQCRVCFEPISGLTYSCQQCVFPLHKWCAELQPQIHLPDSVHPHPLTFSLDEDNYIEDCGICEFGFPCFGAYVCSSPGCKFTIHTECAVLKLQGKDLILFNGVEYSAEPKFMAAEQSCEACGFNCQGSYLQTVAGDKCIHLRCAMLPRTRKHPCHRHDLTLTPSADLEDFGSGSGSESDSDEVYCNICEYEMEKANFVYYCTEEECNLVGHISCANIDVYPPTVNLLISSDMYLEECAQMDENGLLDNNWRAALLKKENRNSASYNQASAEAEKDKARRMERQQEREKGPLPMLEHVLHQHSLELFNEPINYLVPCNACCYPIYGDTYICSECDFYLHKSCADLPPEIQHPKHKQHPLVLKTGDLHRFACQVCCYSLFGLSYRCDACSFEVDMQCAYAHEEYAERIHEYPFMWRQYRYDRDDLCEYFNKNLSSVELFAKGSQEPAPPCAACGNPCEGGMFKCNQHEFYVHFHCSILKPQASHETHRHPLTLNYHPQEDGSDEYYCNACEEERNGKLWVYSCPEPECEFVAHIKCANPNMETIPITPSSS